MSEETLVQTIEVVAAYVANHNIRPDDVAAFIASTHAAVLALDTPVTPEKPELVEDEHTPAVTARKSLANPDFILSMIDGKPYKALRRHLSNHGLTPEQYRARYKLKADYPMVAPSYSEARRSLANSIGLGRKVKEIAGAVVEGAKALAHAGEAGPASGADAQPKRAGGSAAAVDESGAANTGSDATGGLPTRRRRAHAHCASPPPNSSARATRSLPNHKASKLTSRNQTVPGPTLSIGPGTRVTKAARRSWNSGGARLRIAERERRKLPVTLASSEGASSFGSCLRSSSTAWWRRTPLLSHYG